MQDLYHLDKERIKIAAGLAEIDEKISAANAVIAETADAAEPADSAPAVNPPVVTSLWVVQGDYGQGWEDLTASADRDEAKAEAVRYRENDTAPIRVVRQQEGSRFPRH
jgi:hypothetical protein